jgi:hypothetical protein
MVTMMKVCLLLTRACWQLHTAMQNYELLKGPDIDFVTTHVPLLCYSVGLTVSVRC